MKLIKRFVIALTVLLVIGTAYLYIDYRLQRIDNNQAPVLAEQLEVCIREQDEFLLEEICPFSWDTLHIIRPYTSKDKMYKQVGIKWATEDSFVFFLLSRYCFNNFNLDADEVQALVFVEQGKIVCYCVYFRENGDFLQLPKKIELSEAIFTVKRKQFSYPLIEIAP
jgi:hypothetical protein